MWKRQINFHQYIAYLLDLSEGDVLYIVDACYSCSIAVENTRETLAASAIEMTSDARTKGLLSFTQAFCNTIQADPSVATRYKRTIALQPSLRSTLVSYHNGRMRVKATISRLPP